MSRDTIVGIVIAVWIVFALTVLALTSSDYSQPTTPQDCMDHCGDNFTVETNERGELTLCECIE